MTDTTQPTAHTATALEWLIPGSTVTQVDDAPLRDPRIGGPDYCLAPQRWVPTRMTSTFADHDRLRAPTTRRRIEVILGAVYGGTWAGIWSTGRVDLANLEFDRSDSHIWGDARRERGVQVRFGSHAMARPQQDGVS